MNLTCLQAIQGLVGFAQEKRLDCRADGHLRSQRQKLLAIPPCQVGHGTDDTFAPKLEGLLEKVYQEAALPEDRDRLAVNDFLVCWRCDRPSY